MVTVSQSRLAEVESKVASLKSYADLEVTTDTMPWFLHKLGDGGTLVDMSCHLFSIFTASLPLQDMGVVLSAQARGHIKNPRISTVPPEFVGAFTSAQSSARRAVWQNSYDLTILQAVFRGWNYIPWSAWDSLERLVAHGSKQLAEGKEKLLKSRVAARASMEAVLVEIASEAATRINATPGARFPDDDETKFKARVIASGLRRFDEVIARLPDVRFSLQARPIVLGSEILYEQSQETALQGAISLAQSERALAQQKIEMEKKAAFQIAQAKVDAARDDIRKDADVRERVRQIQIQTAKETAESVLNPFREGMVVLRARLNDDLLLIRDNLAKSKELAPTTVNKLRSVAKQFELLNFSNDVELKELIDNVSLFAGMGSARWAPPVDAVLQSLNDVVALTEEAAKDLIRSGRASRIEL